MNRYKQSCGEKMRYKAKLQAHVGEWERCMVTARVEFATVSPGDTVTVGSTHKGMAKLLTSQDGSV